MKVNLLIVSMLCAGALAARAPAEIRADNEAVRVGYTRGVRGTGNAYLKRDGKTYRVPARSRWNLYDGDVVWCEGSAILYVRRIDGGEGEDYRITRRQVLNVQDRESEVPFEELDGHRFRLGGRAAAAG